MNGLKKLYLRNWRQLVLDVEKPGVIWRRKPQPCGVAV